MTESIWYGPPPSRAMTVDSAKTSLLHRFERKRCLQKPGFAYSAAEIGSLRAGAISRARSQYIAIAKASCQAFAAFAVKFFSRQKKMPRRNAEAGAGSSEKLRATTKARRDLLRAAPI